jgi:hypothetical protein
MPAFRRHDADCLSGVEQRADGPDAGAPSRPATRVNGLPRRRNTGLYDEVLALASRTPCDPRRLARAARGRRGDLHPEAATHARRTRGSDARHRAPSAQIPAGAIRAPGSPPDPLARRQAEAYFRAAGLGGQPSAVEDKVALCQSTSVLSGYAGSRRNLACPSSQRPIQELPELPPPRSQRNGSR